MEAIVKDGGEGIVLRNPRGFYETKRSWGSLKLKPYEDSEVVLRSSAKLNETVEVDWKDRVIRVVCNVASVSQGTKATIKYFGTTNDGTPHKPILTRIYSSV